MIVRFIGDVHGKATYYKMLAETSPHPTVQIGDFGYGFNPSRDMAMNEWFMGNERHRFIRGNHDNPAECKKSSGFIPDGHLYDATMYVGGAWSIDWRYRTEGVSWWADEEVSDAQFDQIIELYSDVKPDVMVTHDAPSFVAEWHLYHGDRIYKTRTGQAFDVMFANHKPKLWVYGHWHESVVNEKDGTKFMCIDELDWADVDLSSGEILKSNSLRIVS